MEKIVLKKTYTFSHQTFLEYEPSSPCPFFFQQWKMNS